MQKCNRYAVDGKIYDVQQKWIPYGNRIYLPDPASRNSDFGFVFSDLGSRICLLYERLQIIQSPVNAVFLKEIGVRPAFHKVTILQDNYFIHKLDCG